MKLNPYLAFNGNCEEAMNFYKDCFNGSMESMSRFGDSPMANEQNKDKILHAVLRFDDNVLMGSDSMDGKAIQGGRSVSLALDVNKEQGETLFNKMAQGGTVTMPFEKTFWGAMFGMLTDKFGIHWMLNCDEK